MKKHIFKIVIVSIFFVSCTTTIDTTIQDQFPSTSESVFIPVYGVYDDIPESYFKIGSVKIGDTSFTVDCSYDTVIDQAKAECRKIGGEALKIILMEEPDYSSSCYRITADIYRDRRYKGADGNSSENELKKDDDVFYYTKTSNIEFSAPPVSYSTPSEPIGNKAGPKEIILNDTLYSIDQVTTKWNTWYVYDIYNNSNVLLEFGYFEGWPGALIGFVLFDGTNEGEMTSYSRKGIQHRWDWGPDNDYAFIIDPNGTGAYFDFSNAGDEMVSPKTIYNCVKQD